MVRLTEVRRGQRVRIERIEDETLRAQLVRFGITEGSEVSCLERVWLGPVTLGLNSQEIAVGRAAALRIRVGERGAP